MLMITPAPPSATVEASPTLAHDRLARWIGGFEHDLREFLASRSREIDHLLGTRLVAAPLALSAGRLAEGGVVLVTDEGRGISRALAADLRAMGNPVFRVRHGVSEGGVEGVNLTSAAAVAALVDRAREIGPIAAIVHAMPLRDHPPSTDPDLRGLMLLAHAAADDLCRSAKHGGACLLVATPGENEILSEFVKTLGSDLPGVRIRSVAMDLEGDTEVQAADLVREVLTFDSREEVVYQKGVRLAPLPGQVFEGVASEVFLLGAPNAEAWNVLAEVLIEWISENPGVCLTDLAFTLSHRQPHFPFRVGIVATSSQELVEKLQDQIDGEKSLSIFGKTDPIQNGRDWFHHMAAERFEQGLPVQTDLLYAGRSPRILDLNKSTRSVVAEPDHQTSAASQVAETFVMAMDELMAFQRRMVAAFMGLA